MSFLRIFLLLLPLIAWPTVARAQVEPKPRADEHGFLCHCVMSEYQGGVTQIKVLLPDRMEKGKRYPVLFVLPVEAGDGKQYGNGLVEIKKHDLHNKFGVICVEVTFSQLPWYADHPTDAKIRQETHFLKVVLPFLEQHYPVTKDRAGRLLLGFSKSGWGAFSLLLRHPGVFGKAAAWDAPLMMAAPNKYGMAHIFGTQENFEKYRLSKLLAMRANERSSPSGTTQSSNVIGSVTFAYDRSSVPAMRAPAMPIPLGCTYFEAAGSVRIQRTISARIMRSLPHDAPLEGSLTGLSGSLLGLLQTRSR